MKKTAKSVIALVLTIMMLFSMTAISVSAYTVGGQGFIDYELTVADVNPAVGATDVPVNVTVSDIYGMAAGVLRITFDTDYVTFKSATVDSHFSIQGAALQSVVSGTVKRVTIAFASTTMGTVTDKSPDAVLATLVFDTVGTPAEGTETTIGVEAASNIAVCKENVAHEMQYDATEIKFANTTDGTFTIGTAPADVEIESFDAQTLNVDNGATITGVPTTATANLADGTTASIPVTFDVSGIDTSVAGTTPVNGVVGTLPDGVLNTGAFVPVLNVVVADPIISTIEFAAEDKTVASEEEFEIPVTVTNADSVSVGSVTGVVGAQMTITKDANETLKAINVGGSDITINGDGEYQINAAGTTGVTGTINVAGNTIDIIIVSLDGALADQAAATTLFTLKMQAAENTTDDAITGTISFANVLYNNNVAATIADATVTITPPAPQLYTLAEVRNALRKAIGLTVPELEDTTSNYYKWVDVDGDGVITLSDAVAITIIIRNYPPVVL